MGKFREKTGILYPSLKGENGDFWGWTGVCEKGLHLSLYIMQKRNIEYKGSLLYFHFSNSLNDELIKKKSKILTLLFLWSCIKGNLSYDLYSSVFFMFSTIIEYIKWNYIRSFLEKTWESNEKYF